MASLHLPSKNDLTQFYNGKDISNVPKPAAVLDRAIIRRHCERMKQTIKALNVGFRAHVKTHKTVELTSMQIDTTNPEINLIASTLMEIETVLPLLKRLKESNSNTHKINILHGIPLIPSQITHLAKLGLELGPGGISVMLDHPDQIVHLHKFKETTHFPISVFVKVDTGYHRAGLPPGALNKNGFLEKLAQAERDGLVTFLGLYSHSSLSYGATCSKEAMGYLLSEIRGCLAALQRWGDIFPKVHGRELVISVGATPQVVCSSDLVSGDGAGSCPEAQELMGLFKDPGLVGSDIKVKIELHAGNYPVLDMQQVSTNARNGLGRLEDEIALSVVAEVCSVYNDGERGKPEALVAAGTLALAREPCQSYPGWGVLSSWRMGQGQGQKVGDGKRLIVERISQEHAIVSWEDGGLENIPLEVGQIVKIFPNHSCVTGAFYGWYFVVDSDEDPDASRVVDVWIRGRGDSTDPYSLTRFQ